MELQETLLSTNTFAIVIADLYGTVIRIKHYVKWSLAERMILHYLQVFIQLNMLAGK